VGADLLLLVVVVGSEKFENDVKEEEDVHDVVEYLLSSVWTRERNIERTCDRRVPYQDRNYDIPDVHFKKSICRDYQIVIPRSLLFDFLIMYGVRSKL